MHDFLEIIVLLLVLKELDRKFETDLENMSRQQKRDIEKLESIQQRDLLQATKKLRNDQVGSEPCYALWVQYWNFNDHCFVRKKNSRNLRIILKMKRRQL